MQVKSLLLSLHDVKEFLRHGQRANKCAKVSGISFQLESIFSSEASEADFSEPVVDLIRLYEKLC